MHDLSLEEFIYQVKRELLDAQTKHAAEMGYLSLKSVELTATIAVKPGANLGASIKVVSIGAKIEKEQAHQVKLTFDVLDATPAEAASEKSAVPIAPSSASSSSSLVRRGGKKYR